MFKKRDKEDRVKHMFSRFIQVIINIVKDASITLKSSLGLKGRKTGDGDGSPEN
jgi:hypothetical protein